MGQTNNLHNESFQKDRSLFSFIKRNSHRVGYWSASVFTLNSQHRTANPRLAKAWPRPARHRPGKAGHAPARPARPRPASPAAPGCGQVGQTQASQTQARPSPARPPARLRPARHRPARPVRRRAGQASQTWGRYQLSLIPLLSPGPTYKQTHARNEGGSCSVGAQVARARASRTRLR